MQIHGYRISMHIEIRNDIKKQGCTFFFFFWKVYNSSLFEIMAIEIFISEITYLCNLLLEFWPESTAAEAKARTNNLIFLQTQQ